MVSSGFDSGCLGLVQFFDNQKLTFLGFFSKPFGWVFMAMAGIQAAKQLSVQAPGPPHIQSSDQPSQPQEATAKRL